VTLFFALLSVVAALTALVVGVSAVTGDRVGVVALVAPSALELAAAVAVTATLGSLYLSEVENFLPCRLCWVQRGFMYPAAVLLVAAVVTGRRVPAVVAGGLAVVGFAVAVFHRFEQAADGGVGSFCDPAVPCSSRWIDHFGFVTIPTMAAAGFATIAVLVAVAMTSYHDRQQRSSGEAQ
jgi:disulfide bond formation protein DsbB